MTTKVRKWRYEFNEVRFPNQQKAYDLIPKVFCKPGKHSWIELPYLSKGQLGTEICGSCRLCRIPKKTEKSKKTSKKATKKKGSELVKTAKYFWAWGRKNLTFKMILIGTVAFILGIELIRGLFF